MDNIKINFLCLNKFYLQKKNIWYINKIVHIKYD